MQCNTTMLASATINRQRDARYLSSYELWLRGSSVSIWMIPVRSTLLRKCPRNAASHQHDVLGGDLGFFHHPGEQALFAFDKSNRSALSMWHFAYCMPLSKPCLHEISKPAKHGLRFGMRLFSHCKHILKGTLSNVCPCIYTDEV